jgi:Zn-dependent peptidase ImmA (M78 family)
MAQTIESGLSFGAIESLANRIREIVDSNSPEKEISQKLQWLVCRLNGKINIAAVPSEKEVAGGSLVIYGDRSFVIYVSPQTSPLRDNFTIAHELGHYFMHTNLEDSDENSKPISFHRYGSDRKEWEANRFAAAFLMPKNEFIKKFDEYGGSVPLLSGYFGVSSPAVKVRIECLGLNK